MEDLFIKDKFDASIHLNPNSWSLKQKKRIAAFDPDASEDRIVNKILNKVDGDVRNAIKSQLSAPYKWDMFLMVFKDIFENTTICSKKIYQNKPRKLCSQNRNKFKDDKMQGPSSTQVQPSTSDKKSPQACPNCGSRDPKHQWRGCKDKKINMIEEDLEESDHMNDEYEFQGGPFTGE